MRVTKLDKALLESESPKLWPDSKELTYKEALSLAMAYYAQGGDAFYETWEEYQFKDYVKQHGPMTVKDMKSMFLTQYEVQKDMEGSGQYQESKSKSNKLSQKIREAFNNDRESREAFRKFIRDNNLLRNASSMEIQSIEDNYVNGKYNKTALVNELWSGDTLNRSRQDIEELVDKAELIAPKVDQEFEDNINTLINIGKSKGSEFSLIDFYHMMKSACDKYGEERVKAAIEEKSAQ